MGQPPARGERLGERLSCGYNFEKAVKAGELDQLLHLPAGRKKPHFAVPLLHELVQAHQDSEAGAVDEAGGRQIDVQAAVVGAERGLDAAAQFVGVDRGDFFSAADEKFLNMGLRHSGGFIAQT
jgi:hypothetical protein